jgi:methylisocitrate lyase
MRSTVEATIERTKRLVDAGADAIFPEALESLKEFAAVRAAIDVPMLANMTEFGKSDLFSTRQLREVGVNLVIWPVSLLRMAMGAAERALETLQTDGSLTSQLTQMQHRRDLYDLLDYEGYNKFDASVFNSRVAD